MWSFGWSGPGAERSRTAMLSRRRSGMSVDQVPEGPSGERSRCDPEVVEEETNQFRTKRLGRGRLDPMTRRSRGPERTSASSLLLLFAHRVIKRTRLGSIGVWISGAPHPVALAPLECHLIAWAFWNLNRDGAIILEWDDADIPRAKVSRGPGITGDGMIKECLRVRWMHR